MSVICETAGVHKLLLDDDRAERSLVASNASHQATLPTLRSPDTGRPYLLSSISTCSMRSRGACSCCSCLPSLVGDDKGRELLSRC